MRMLRCVVALLLVVCFLPSVVRADIPDADFNKAMDKYLQTEAGQGKLGDAIQNYFKKQQDKAQKEQTERQAAQIEDQFKNPVKLDPGKSPVRGPATAKVTIIEFSDFECPFCKRGHETMDKLREAYPKDVKFVFKNLPLPFHQKADPAARAALAAGKQGKFWEMHDALFVGQAQLGPALYEAEAKKLGLDVEKFKKDMDDPALKALIAADSEDARKIGISGTPGYLVNGVLVKGAYPFEHFKMIIDRWLTGPPAAK